MAEVQTHNEAGEMTQVFIEFVMMHAQNAALFLGQIPNPRGQEVEVNLPLAKMFIDQLAVLRVKTKGNLNPDEKKVIESAVSQLQAAFVEVAQLMRAENIGADIPEMRVGFGDVEETAETAAPAPPPEPAPPAAAAPPPAPAPVPEPPPEEGRKRFSKSYGS